jgi:DNA-binding NtrC family response regulator
VLLADRPTFDSSIEALRLHAADYLTSRSPNCSCRPVLARLAPPAAFNSEIGDLADDVETRGHFGQLWGRSAPMRRVYDRMSRVSRPALRC